MREREEGRDLRQGSLDSSSQINQQVPRTPTFPGSPLLHKIGADSWGGGVVRKKAQLLVSLEDDKIGDSQSMFLGT